MYTNTREPTEESPILCQGCYQTELSNQDAVCLGIQLAHLPD